MNDDCCPRARHSRAARPHIGDRIGFDGTARLPAVRRRRDRCRSSRRRPRPWGRARGGGRWIGNDRWRSGGSLRGRDCRKDQRQGALVSDTARSFLPSACSVRASSRSRRLRGSRSRGGRARLDGRGIILWRSRCCGRRDRSPADGDLKTPPACRREDRNARAGRAAMATPERGKRLRAADRLDDTVAGQCPSLGRTAGPWHWTSPLASRTDAGQSRRMRRIHRGSL